MTFAKPRRCRRLTGRATTLLVAWLMVAPGVSPAVEPGGPLPPSPEDLPAERFEVAGEVQPVAFDSAATSAIDRPLPLATETGNGSAAAAQPAASAIPRAGNWTFLLAIAAAFMVLAAFRLKPLRAARSLPADVFEVLGEGSLGGQHAVRVVRFGPRTLLVAVSSAGSQTLAELTDPQATERIVAACTASRSVRSGSGVTANAPPRPRPVSSARPETAGGEAA